jgi:hypothetical protein
LRLADDAEARWDCTLQKNATEEEEEEEERGNAEEEECRGGRWATNSAPAHSLQAATRDLQAS